MQRLTAFLKKLGKSYSRFFRIESERSSVSLDVKKRFVKSSFTLLSGNAIVLILSSSYQFLLPKVVSVQDYGTFKAFTLYLSYLGLTHFGLKDSIYLRFCASKSLEPVERNAYYSLILLQQFIVVTLLCSFLSSLGTMGRFSIIVMLSVTAFFQVLSTFYESYFFSQKLFMQSVVSKLVKEGSFLIMLGALIYCFQMISVSQLLLVFTLASFLQFVFYFLRVRKVLTFSWMALRKRSRSWFAKLYQVGFSIQGGNLSHQISVNVDRLLVSFYYSKEIFGPYAFAGTFVVLINIAVTSFSQVLLPYLFDQKRLRLQEGFDRLSRQVFLLSCLSYPGIWLSQMVIGYFYPSYAASQQILFGLSFGVPPLLIVTFLHNNYLKVLNLLRWYNVINWSVLAVFVMSFYFLMGRNVSIHVLAIMFSGSFVVKVLCNELLIRMKLGYTPQSTITPMVILAIGALINYLMHVLLI